MQKRIRNTAVLLFAALLTTATLATAQVDGEAEEAYQPTIAEIVMQSEDFSTLATALEAAGLVDTLMAPGATFTVLAPTNAAFEQLPEGQLAELLEPENQAALRDLLLYHVLPDAASSADISAMQHLETLQSMAAVPVNMDGGGLTVGGANVVQADVEAANGVIHVVDQVLMPAADSPEKM